MNETRRKPTTGRQSPSLFDKWHRIFLYQAANLAGFRAPEDPRFEAGIPDFMNGIPDFMNGIPDFMNGILNFSIHFNVVHRKVDWRNPKMKSLNSMPVYQRCHACLEKK